LQTLSMTVGSVFETRDVMYEPAEHAPTVFRVSLSVENVLMPTSSRVENHAIGTGSWDTAISVVHSQEPSGCFRMRPM
jgi:hypothetical protein